MTELLFELFLGIGSIAIGVLQFIFFAWLALFLGGLLLGLIMDPYYGLPNDRDRKRKLEEKKNAEDHS